jgi:hypothetical protein
MLFSAWDAYHVKPEKPFSEAEIDAELRRLRR